MRTKRSAARSTRSAPRAKRTRGKKQAPEADSIESEEEASLYSKQEPSQKKRRLKRIAKEVSRNGMEINDNNSENEEEDVHTNDGSPVENLNENNTFHVDVDVDVNDDEEEEEEEEEPHMMQAMMKQFVTEKTRKLMDRLKVQARQARSALRKRAHQVRLEIEVNPQEQELQEARAQLGETDTEAANNDVAKSQENETLVMEELDASMNQLSTIECEIREELDGMEALMKEAQAARSRIDQMLLKASSTSTGGLINGAARGVCEMDVTEILRLATLAFPDRVVQE